MIGKIVLASNNPGKLKELTNMLQRVAIEVCSMGELGISSCDEPYPTFIENALTKARHVSKESGLPALADDSGICVPALNGRPGVYSARYAGEDGNDAANNQQLLQDMQGISQRDAYYYCALVLLRHADDPQPIIAEGIWHGQLREQPQGDGGFGYDPLFFLPALNKTCAELTPEQKNPISHRGQALQQLLNKLQAI